MSFPTTTTQQKFVTYNLSRNKEISSTNDNFFVTTIHLSPVTIKNKQSDIKFVQKQPDQSTNGKASYYHPFFWMDEPAYLGKKKRYFKFKIENNFDKQKKIRIDFSGNAYDIIIQKKLMESFKNLTLHGFDIKENHRNIIPLENDKVNQKVQFSEINKPLHISYTIKAFQRVEFVAEISLTSLISNEMGASSRESGDMTIQSFNDENEIEKTLKISYKKTLASECHPSHSMVNYQGPNGITFKKKIQTVKIGDFIESENNIFEPVIAITHHNTNDEFKYLKFKCIDIETPLYISPGHYMHVNRGELKLASKINTSDTLIHQSKNVRIESIEQEYAQGAHHLVLKKGKCLVDGFQTSIFTNISNLYLQKYVFLPIVWLMFMIEKPLVCNGAEQALEFLYQNKKTDKQIYQGFRGNMINILMLFVFVSKNLAFKLNQNFSDLILKNSST